MTRGEAINWIINLTADIGKMEHQDLWHYEQALEEIRDMIEAMPLEQPERIRGRWTDKDGGLATCSACGDRWGVWSVMNFCPNCGADMRDKEDQDD